MNWTIPPVILLVGCSIAASWSVVHAESWNSFGQIAVSSTTILLYSLAQTKVFDDKMKIAKI